jgi:hypothetical protein
MIKGRHLWARIYIPSSRLSYTPDAVLCGWENGARAEQRWSLICWTVPSNNLSVNCLCLRYVHTSVSFTVPDFAIYSRFHCFALRLLSSYVQLFTMLHNTTCVCDVLSPDSASASSQF